MLLGAESDSAARTSSGSFSWRPPQHHRLVFRGSDSERVRNCETISRVAVLVDGGLIEAFANGLVTITALVNPDSTTGNATQVMNARVIGICQWPCCCRYPFKFVARQSSRLQRTNSFNNSALLPPASCSVESWQMASVQPPSVPQNHERR